MLDSQEQRVWIRDSSVLGRYLPDTIVHQVLEADVPQASEDDLRAQVVRLQNLLQVIVSYVPEHAEAAKREQAYAALGHISRVDGTLLAADLSGFTAFSAQLSTLGSEGAELVAHTVSTLFSTLLGALGEWGGSLLKLSGDALTALFSGPDHVRRAATAALALQKHMEAFQALATPAGTFALKIRIGLASGDVVLAEIGSAERIELLVAGATAQQVMELQRQAAPGTVVLSRAAYQAIRLVSQALTLSSQLYRIQSIEPFGPPERPPAREWITRNSPTWELQALIGRIEAVRPYLVDQYLDRMAYGPLDLAGAGDLRPVTVLFACLSDAGALVERAEPGESDPALAELQSRARRLWAIVEQHGGTINKIDMHREGHTLIVLFGAPIAQGRAAARAVSCALALLRDRDAPAEESMSDDTPLRVRRVGIATGRVFAGAVGSASRREYTVMGSVVNLAARLMDVAAEGQALLDSNTAQAAERLARLQEQPPVLVKGFDQPVPFYQVITERRSALSALVRAQPVLVGRTDELEQADTTIARALSGQGGILALVGEAGIGKSRLLAELARRSLIASARDSTVVIVQAQPYSRFQPYSLAAEIFRQLFDLPEQALAAAATLMAQISHTAPEHERFRELLPTLFGLASEDTPLTQALTPDERRARLHDLAVALLLERTHMIPTALVLEDLHWCDTASLELVGALATAGRARQLLLLVTYRPEGAPTWPADTNLTQIVLQPLTPEQSHVLVASWMGAAPISQTFKDAVVERTLGNPFFLEEIARALQERALTSDAEPALPASIHSALLERLDQLPLEDRYVLQLAAVIGPLFQRALLADVAGDRVDLDQVLEQLTGRALIRPVGEDRYSFAHNLTQETAYESLLFAQRRDIHRQIADLLRASSVEQTDPGLLAYHYRRTEAWAEALEYDWRAGQRAQTLYAGDIAQSHYQLALEALDRLGDADLVRRRPEILRHIGDLHALAGRYADAVDAYETALAGSSEDHERAEVLICWAEVREQQANYDDALVLLDQAAGALAPDAPLALRATVRRGYVQIRQGDAEAARATIAGCLEQLERRESWSDLLLAYRIFFLIAYGQSRWSEARSYLRLALACAEKAGDIREIARLHNNTGVVLGQEGNLREAAQSFERATRVMEQIDDRYNLASVHVNTGVIYYKLGDFAAALEHYITGLRVASAIGDPYHQSIARGNLGELYRRMGQLEESVEQLRQSVELCEQTKDDLGLSEAYRQLGETYIALDLLAEAARACEQARQCAIVAGDPQAEAISYRVRALLATQRGDYESALADARRSIQMLTELGSTHELGQSMVTLATILIREGQSVTACDMLSEAIGLLHRAGAAADQILAENLLKQACG